MMMLDDIRAQLRDRLAAKGAEDPGATIPDDLVPFTGALPGWWTDRGNVILVRPGQQAIPRLMWFPGVIPATAAVVVLAGTGLPSELLLFDQAPMVVLGMRSALVGASLCCGNGATLVIGDDVVSTGGAQIDSRHGGLVSVGRDGLWAGSIRIMSDDMHPIRDRGGRRINARGGTVTVGTHVWLGTEAMLLSGSRVGAGSVLGARSLVKGRLPENAVCVGSPAKAIRHAISWDKEDLP